MCVSACVYLCSQQQKIIRKELDMEEKVSQWKNHRGIYAHEHDPGLFPECVSSASPQLEPRRKAGAAW